MAYYRSILWVEARNRYPLCSAPIDPKAALFFAKEAEQWTGDLWDIPENLTFITLGVKWGKASRNIIKGDAKRELAVMEAKACRKHNALLDGRTIYCWINRTF